MKNEQVQDWIKACKSPDPKESLKRVARELYDNDSPYVIACELARICDDYNLTTTLELVNYLSNLQTSPR